MKADFTNTKLYDIVVSHITNEDGESCMTYGIISEDGPVVLDVSCNKYFVEGLVQKLNDLKLSPIHLMDVVADAI